MKLPELCFVFDVESVGLHGEGFMFGYVVLKDGKNVDEGLYCCPIVKAEADPRNPSMSLEWCRENIPHCEITNTDPAHLRQAFWSIWTRWKIGGDAIMFAECAWPVEAQFLLDCISDGNVRGHNGPYPLHDIASIMLACGMDPLATYDRLPDELPKHNPLCDARQSARLLIEAFNR